MASRVFVRGRMRPRNQEPFEGGMSVGEPQVAAPLLLAPGVQSL